MDSPSIRRVLKCCVKGLYWTSLERVASLKYKISLFLKAFWGLSRLHLYRTGNSIGSCYISTVEICLHKGHIDSALSVPYLLNISRSPRNFALQQFAFRVGNNDFA